MDREGKFAIHFAKQIAPFLKTQELQLPLSVNIKLFIGSIIGYVVNKIADRHEESEQGRGVEIVSTEGDDEKILSDTGISTREEENAYEVVVFAGMALSRFIWHAESLSKDGYVVEITRAYIHTNFYGETESIPEEIRMDESVLKKMLLAAIADGIYCLEDHYYGVPLYKGMPRQFKIVNSDFKEKATEKLWEEISSRIESGGKVNVLERVSVRRGADGMFYMEHDREEIER